MKINETAAGMSIDKWQTRELAAYVRVLEDIAHAAEETCWGCPSGTGVQAMLLRRATAPAWLSERMGKQHA